MLGYSRWMYNLICFPGSEGADDFDPNRLWQEYLSQPENLWDYCNPKNEPFDTRAMNVLRGFLFEPVDETIYDDILEPPGVPRWMMGHKDGVLSQSAPADNKPVFDIICDFLAKNNARNETGTGPWVLIRLEIEGGPYIRMTVVDQGKWYDAFLCWENNTAARWGKSSSDMSAPGMHFFAPRVVSKDAG